MLVYQSLSQKTSLLQLHCALLFFRSVCAQNHFEHVNTIDLVIDWTTPLTNATGKIRYLADKGIEPTFRCWKTDDLRLLSANMDMQVRAQAIHMTQFASH